MLALIVWKYPIQWEEGKMKPRGQSIREHPRTSQATMAVYAQCPKKMQVMLGNVVFTVDHHLFVQLESLCYGWNMKYLGQAHMPSDC